MHPGAIQNPSKNKAKKFAGPTAHGVSDPVLRPCFQRKECGEAAMQECGEAAMQQCGMQGCFTAYLFSKERRRSRGHLCRKYHTHPPADLPSSRRHAPYFHFLRSKKSVMYLDRFWQPRCLQNPSKMPPKTGKKASKN